MDQESPRFKEIIRNSYDESITKLDLILQGKNTKSKAISEKKIKELVERIHSYFAYRQIEWKDCKIPSALKNASNTDYSNATIVELEKILKDLVKEHPKKVTYFKIKDREEGLRKGEENFHRLFKE